MKPLIVPASAGWRESQPGAVVNHGHPIAQNIMYALACNEGAYAPQDSSFYTYTNILFNGSDSLWLPSPYGWSFKFGASTYLGPLGASDTIWCPPQFSVFALVKMVGTSSSDRTLFGSFNNSSAFDLAISSTGNIKWEQQGNTTLLTSTHTISNDVWHSVGVSHNNTGGNITIYIDGQPDTRATGKTATIAKGGNIGWGSNNSFFEYNFFKSQMAVFICWSRVLSDAEFQWLQQNPFGLWYAAQ